MDPVQGQMIWKCPKPYNYGSTPDPDKIRLEFPNLIRFRDQWYCGFREGQIHHTHPSGRGRIIRSRDGRTWETVKTLQWDGGDVREPKMCITAGGELMVCTSITFTSGKSNDHGGFGRLGYLVNGKLPPGEEPNPAGSHESDAEFSLPCCQSVTWLSGDGENWSSVYACPTGFNTWRWGSTWHNGMGYSLAQWGTGMRGPLYRTRDGKSWRVLNPACVPPGECSEGALAFGTDDTCYCLLRSSNREVAKLGIGKAPYYQDWRWKKLMVDWDGDGNARPIEQVLRSCLGGPRMIRLRDGRLLAAGRVRPPARPDGRIWRAEINPDDPHAIEDGRVILFLLDPERATLTRCADIDGTSYPGICEHEGMIWISYIVYWGEEPGVYLVKVPLPGQAGRGGGNGPKTVVGA